MLAPVCLHRGRGRDPVKFAFRGDFVSQLFPQTSPDLSIERTIHLTMISSAAAVVILFAQSALGYSLCTNAPFPYDGTDMAPIPIVQTQESANGAPFKVSGFIKITDKCGFQTQNFTLTGLGAGVVATWFGSFPGDPAGVSLTEKTPVQANAENAVSQSTYCVALY